MIHNGGPWLWLCVDIASATALAIRIGANFLRTRYQKWAEMQLFSGPEGFRVKPQGQSLDTSEDSRLVNQGLLWTWLNATA